MVEGYIGGGLVDDEGVGSFLRVGYSFAWEFFASGSVDELEIVMFWE
jgi:hypothetical protein